MYKEWISILSSSLQRDRLRALSLDPCYQISNTSQLMQPGKSSNKQQTWSGHYRYKIGKHNRRVLRSVLDIGSVLNDNINSGSLSYFFDHYVSLEIDHRISLIDSTFLDIFPKILVLIIS